MTLFFQISPIYQADIWNLAFYKNSLSNGRVLCWASLFWTWRPLLLLFCFAAELSSLFLKLCHRLVSFESLLLSVAGVPAFFFQSYDKLSQVNSFYGFSSIYNCFSKTRKLCLCPTSPPIFYLTPLTEVITCHV